MLKFFVLLLSLNIYSHNCTQTHAAFDIGSGATKIKVAKVDTCHQKILKVLFDTSLPVAYKQGLKNNHNNFSKDLINEGISAINKLKHKVRHLNPLSFTGVATSAFRTASNGKEALEKIKKGTSVNIQVINQGMEAKLGFIGAMQLSNSKLQDLVVWDIGGGSMQIITRNKNKEFDIYEGKIASVSFKNNIIEKIQKLNPNKVKSPNPITKKVQKAALKYAKDIALSTIPKSIMKKIKSKNTSIIGIGGVHYYSLLKTLKLKSSFSKNDLISHINNHLNFTDQMLGGGKYVDTALSNFILVLGFMEAMSINRIQVGKVNLADGLLINPKIFL